MRRQKALCCADWPVFAASAIGSGRRATVCSVATVLTAVPSLHVTQITQAEHVLALALALALDCLDRCTQSVCDMETAPH